MEHKLKVFMKKVTVVVLLAMALLALALCAGAALCAGVDDVKIPAIYTVPHELDCLLEAGHIQGACCSEKAIYLSHSHGILKIGVIRNKALRKDGKKGLVRVWDEDLNVLREAWFDEALDGIAVIGDTVYVGVDRWGPDKHDGCCVKRLTKDLLDRGNVDLDLGYQIHYGVQTMATDGTDLFLGNYGGTSRVAKNLTNPVKVKLNCAEGFGLVPKSVSKCDTPVFFVVKALGGNMQGWRKDPVNNPPQIRINFYTYSGDAFKDVTVLDKTKKR